MKKLKCTFVMLFLINCTFGQQCFQVVDSIVNSALFKEPQGWQILSFEDGLVAPDSVIDYFIPEVTDSVQEIYISKEINIFTNLHYLTIYGDAIVYFPKEVIECKQLVSIELLCNTNDQSFPLVESNLPNLKIVVLYGKNNITSIPEIILKSERIEYLYVNLDNVENKQIFKEIKSLSKKTNLKVVVITNYKIGNLRKKKLVNQFERKGKCIDL